MSTRAAIARPNGDGFLGRYHHWDGYPQGLGQTLYELAQSNEKRHAMELPPTPWNGDVEQMLKVLIDDHPAGWSTINGADFSLLPGFIEMGSPLVPCVICQQDQNAHLCQYDKNHGEPKPCKAGQPATLYNEHLGHVFEPEPKAQALAQALPQCYCHGDRDEEGWDVDQDNASGSGCEYAYVITGRKMTVLSSYAEFDGERQKMIGFFGMGAEDAEWQPIGYVDFDKPAPNWEAMYKAQYPEEEGVEV